MLSAVQDRENALASLEGAAAFGHRPQRFHSAALGNAGLAQRLTQTAALSGHSGAVNTLSWTEGGEVLASGGEDCRLRLWRGSDGELLHNFDTGHTANILSACFLPASRGDQLICCSADRQIRHLNVTKGAVRPYLVHQGRVRAVVPLDPHVFLSASEDGTVREFDVRQRPAAVHRDALAGDDSNVLVDQRGERVGKVRVRVGIHSLAVDEQRPWMMLTGGTDPLLRLYDRRMLPAAGAGAAAAAGAAQHAGARAKAPQWVACYAPSHIKAALWDSAAPAKLRPPGHHLTAVAFARGGSEVVGSYSGELIYSFDVTQHARDVEALLHIPSTVLRGPARPRSHARRHSSHGYAVSQQPQLLSPATLPAGATVEGGGGTMPLTGEHAAAMLVHTGHPLQQQQQQRALAGRGIAIAPSVRQLEQQWRQQSRMAAATVEAPRAESSRQAHWQLHPTSSTLRSPRHETRDLAPNYHQQYQQQYQLHQHQQQAHCHDLRRPHELVSDSDGASEGFSPDGRECRRAGVRRSRRIMRRRRDAAEAAELQQLAEDAAAEAAAEEEDEEQPQERQVQWPGMAGLPSSSDSEDPALHSPATQVRRVRRRTLAGCAADEDAAAAAAAAVAVQHQESAEQGGGGGERGAAVAAATAAAAGHGAEGDGGFKAPAGRSPLQHHRRRQAAVVAAAAAALQRLDSTVGLLHHHALQLEASEVAAGSRGWDGATQQDQQEATVSMRHGVAAAGTQGGGFTVEQTAAMEASSRPLLSGSQGGLGTQLSSQQGGHEASSLDSAEQPGNERVGSVAQRARADAPSVGNAPLDTTATAARDAAGQRQAAAEAKEASTGHNRFPPPLPQFAAAEEGQQQQAQQQQQQRLPPSRPRQRQQLQPTASTGTSRPPAFGSHQQRCLRRHSAGLDASQHGGNAAAVADGLADAMGSQAVPPTASAAAKAEQQGQQAALEAQQQQPQPQATMLSGRGPSVLGDFMPGQDQPTGSEIQQRPASVAAGGGTWQAGEAQQQRRQQRRQVESAIGAIVHVADADDGEEVSEPTMYRRCFAGHLNLAPVIQDGLPLALQLAFLGRHSELLVSPSDDGNVFIWDYGSGRLVAVLPPPVPAASGSTADGQLADLAAAAAAGGGTCVAPHPLLPVLASGGMDSVVRLWSPEAGQGHRMEHAAAVVRANLEQLAAAGWQQPVSRAGLAGALLGSGGGDRGWAPLMLAGPDRCHTM